MNGPRDRECRLAERYTSSSQTPSPVQRRMTLLRAAASFVAWVDNAQHIALLSFNDELAAPFIENIEERELKSSWHLIQPDGTRLKKGAAALALLEQLRRTRGLAHWIRVSRLHWLVAAGNTFLHLIRKKAGRFVPNVPEIRRWP